jgi:hypothetical protein
MFSFMKLFIPLLLCLGAGPVTAQDTHRLTSHVSYGGFGGPALRFTELNGQFGMLAGGNAGWMINRWLAVGAGGYALLGSGIGMTGSRPAGVQEHLSFTYGGLELQYLNRPDYRTHVVVSALVGAGNVSSHAGTLSESDGVFVAEPGILVTKHLTRAIHLQVGATWRFISGSTLPGAGNSDLSGFAGLIGMGFGHF